MNTQPPIRVFTAFSGYDAQCIALEYLEQGNSFRFDLVGWSEIDKYAIQAHNIIFPTKSDLNFGDITAIDWNKVPDFDLFTMSAPCQDFSQAGAQKGGAEGSRTRSSLLWQCRKAITAKRPRYVVFENVKAITNKRHIGQFQKWQAEMKSLGYTNHTAILDALDYGMPQSRERLFMVSILNDSSADAKGYEFPKKTPLGKDKDLCFFIEKDVPFKYHLSPDKAREVIGQIKNLSESLEAQGSRAAWIVSYTRNSKGKVTARRLKSYANTIHASRFESTEQYVLDATDKKNLIVRYLTPSERLRLQGVHEVDIMYLTDEISERQICKLAGNSICVPVLYHIFRQLFTPHAA